MSQGIFSSIVTALSESGASSSTIATAISSIGQALNTVSSQVSTKLNALASLVNNPQAYAAAAPGIINAIESINGLPATVLPLLETLRTSTDPLKIAQTIAAIEAMVSAQTSAL